MSISPTTDTTAYTGTTNQPNGDPNTTSSPYSNNNIYYTQQGQDAMNKSTTSLFSASSNSSNPIGEAYAEDDPDAPPPMKVNIP